MILAVIVEAAETSRTTDQKKNSAEIVIGLSKGRKDAYAGLSHLIAMNNGKIAKIIATKKEVLAIVAEMPLDLIPAFVEKATGLAEYVEPKLQFQAESLPNDPDFSLQWGPKKIEADWAWNTTVGSSDVLVAVIDSGIFYNHPDLAANYVALGYDWVNNDIDPMDDYGHGTKVAGIIAASINNGIGIAGLAQVKVMAEKVFDKVGTGWNSWIADAIVHATDQGAKIISMSLSTGSNDSLIYSAVKYAYEKNVLLVAAAGNEEDDAKRYPAAYDEVIAVTSTDENDQRASESNFGDWIELAAPGENIWTTDLLDENLPPDYQYYRYGSGTSFACPHVSGLAALIWSQFPNATRDWVRNRLRDTADDLGDSGFDIIYGYGRINARKAFNGTSPSIHYTLAIATTTGGTTNPAPGNHTYSEGQNVSVQAIPDTGYRLDHWELDGVNISSANPYPVLMDNDHLLQAVFAPITYTLEVTTTIGGTTNPEQGVYTYNAGSRIQVTAVPNTNYTLDYWELDNINMGKANPLDLTIEGNHTLKAVFRLSVSDIAVTKMVLSKTIVGQGYSTDVNVVVANQGDYTENFDVTLYANATSIESENVTLSSGNSADITFTWDTTGFAYGNYNISAVADVVPNETDITDNNCTFNGSVLVTIPGDIDGSFKVGLADLVDLAMAYGYRLGDSNWNPNADIDSNNTAGLSDLVTLAQHYGQHYP
jgi:subtilisin family serine protease